ncbi:MAG: CapA family protein [Paracoccaceae bacterium]
MDFSDENRNDFSGEDFSTNSLIAREFRNLGFRVEDFGGVIRSTWNGVSTFNMQSETEFNTQLAFRLAKNKVWAKALLAEAGLSVAKGQHFALAEKEAARRLVVQLERAAVKPLDGHHGKGVSVDVTRRTFDRAWEKASRTTAKGVIVERFFEGGKDARYLAIDGKCVAVYLRMPTFVLGDGISTIDELIEKTNRVRRLNPCRAKYLIGKTPKQLAFLDRRGLDVNSVVSSGQIVELDIMAGPARNGGDAVSITDKAHSSMVEMVEKIARTIPGLHVLGVDVFAKDHSKPATPDNYIVMEVNTNPRILGQQFPDFGEPVNVARLIVESCVERLGLSSTLSDAKRSKSLPAQVLKTSANIAPQDNEMTLVFGGDTSLGDTYLARGTFPEVQDRLRDAPQSFFEKLQPLIADKSHFMLNFESVLSGSAADPWDGQKKYMGLDDPERTISALKSIGVDSVSLANNHSMDFGAAPLLETIDHFKTAEVNVIGAGSNRFDSALPLTLSTHIGNVYVLGGYEYRRSYHEKYRFYSARSRPGVQRFRQAAENQMADEIRDIRKIDPTAFIIAFPHWGGARNYTWAQAKMFTANTSLLKAGADLVLGHGAHMMQQCWVEDGDTTIFSLGNFVFNSPGRYQKIGAPPYSLVARLNLQRHGDQWATRLRLYPIVSDNRATDFMPRPVTEEEALDVYELLTARGQRIFRTSFELGQDDRGYFLERSGPVSRRCSLID